MHDVHIIRLRGPWQFQVGNDVETVRLPHKPSGDLHGPLRYTRGFHTPEGLEDLEQVWLVVEPLPAGAMVQLNGHALSLPRSEITRILAPFNQLEIVIPQPSDGLHDGICLEIGFP